MDALKKYHDENKERYLNELLDWLRIQSISADPKYKGDVQKAAQYLADRFTEVGMDNIKIHPTEGHPIVYAEKMIDKAAPTVLVYGHYDVQPPDPLELWTSPPFDPVIRDGKIYARGSCDDKGQVYMHVKAIEAMLRNDLLNCNIKCMIEGEEEVGSGNLEIFCEKYKSMLDCDVILISDTALISNSIPSITTGLRGLSYVEVSVVGPNKDLHSGVYGGAVANPLNVLCSMIDSLKDSNNHITIPGFYDKVELVSQDERAAMNAAPYNEETYKEELGIQAVVGESGYTTLERTTIRPTLDVNGIWGGYIGEGAKTVLPSKAQAKISMRLVPHQDPNEITRLFTAHFKSIAPPGVKVTVQAHHGGYPVVIPVDSLEYKAAHQAMEKSFGKEPLPQRSGGSIPIVALFEKVLGVKSILMGFGLDSDDIHSPDEHFGLFNFYKGIETIPYFYQFYAQMKKDAPF